MIAIDQPHKHNIAVIKGDRGAIGIFEDKYNAFFLSLSFCQYFFTSYEDFKRVFRLPSAKWQGLA